MAPSLPWCPKNSHADRRTGRRKPRDLSGPAVRRPQSPGHALDPIGRAARQHPQQAREQARPAGRDAAGNSGHHRRPGPRARGCSDGGAGGPLPVPATAVLCLARPAGSGRSAAGRDPRLPGRRARAAAGAGGGEPEPCQAAAGGPRWGRGRRRAGPRSALQRRAGREGRGRSGHRRAGAGHAGPGAGAHRRHRRRAGRGRLARAGGGRRRAGRGAGHGRVCPGADGRPRAGRDHAARAGARRTSGDTDRHRAAGRPAAGCRQPPRP